MIQGTVTADREPIVRIVVRDTSGQDHAHDAVVDTGFTGWLTLPPSVIASLNLPWREWGAGILANGGSMRRACRVALWTFGRSRLALAAPGAVGGGRTSIPVTSNRSI